MMRKVLTCKRANLSNFHWHGRDEHEDCINVIQGSCDPTIITLDFRIEGDEERYNKLKDRGLIISEMDLSDENVKLLQEKAIESTLALDTEVKKMGYN